MGTLFVVATPIGNLNDFSKRAEETLRQSNLILVEDTRQTIKLLNHFDIKVKMLSYHKFNERERVSEIINLLNEGNDISLVSDAGTPCISDPGYILIKEALENDIKVIGIPGCSAVITSLSVSGLDTSSFAFYGFVPTENKAKKELFERIKHASVKTKVIYESPKRIIKLLEYIKKEIPGCVVSVCTELTKVHEHTIHGKIEEVYEKMKMMVVVNRRTDEMMVDEVPAIVADRQNLVHLNGKTVEINDYANDIIYGYQKVTEFLINKKESFLNKLDILISKDDMFRTVLRHTQVYSKYLSAALHPDYLVNTEKRLQLFQRLMTNCKNEHEIPRVKDEISTLMTGDVPYYMFDYYSRDLYSGNGLVSKNYFTYSAREICIERMNHLEEFMKPNIGLIQKSLLTAYVNKPEVENTIVYKCCRKSSNYIENIKFADDIVSNIFYLEDQKGAIFFINGLYNNRISLETINLNMYEGGGLIYYLAAIGKVYNRDKYLHAANTQSIIAKL